MRNLLIAAVIAATSLWSVPKAAAQMGTACASIDECTGTGYPGAMYVDGAFDFGSNGSHLYVIWDEVDENDDVVIGGDSGAKEVTYIGVTDGYWYVYIEDANDFIVTAEKRYQIRVMMHYNDMTPTAQMDVGFATATAYVYSAAINTIGSSDPGKVTASGIYTHGLTDDVALIMEMRKQGDTAWIPDTGISKGSNDTFTWEKTGLPQGETWEFRVKVARTGGKPPEYSSVVEQMVAGMGGMGM